MKELEDKSFKAIPTFKGADFTEQVESIDGDSFYINVSEVEKVVKLSDVKEYIEGITITPEETNHQINKIPLVMTGVDRAIFKSGVNWAIGVIKSKINVK